MEKAKDYFDREYDSNHIAIVVAMSDLESLYGLMEEYAEVVKKSYTRNVLDRLPEDTIIRDNAREMDEKEFEKWWWETVYKKN